MSEPYDNTDAFEYLYDATGTLDAPEGARAAKDAPNLKECAEMCSDITKNCNAFMYDSVNSKCYMYESKPPICEKERKYGIYSYAKEDVTVFPEIPGYQPVNCDFGGKFGTHSV